MRYEVRPEGSLDGSAWIDSLTLRAQGVNDALLLARLARIVEMGGTVETIVGSGRPLTVHFPPSEAEAVPSTPGSEPNGGAR